MERNGSSSCTTTLYWLPVRGSVKIDGFTLTLLLSENSAAWAMSRWLSPAHGRLLPVHHDVELGVVLLAADEDVGDPGDLLDRRGRPPGRVLGVLEVVAELLHLDRLTARRS